MQSKGKLFATQALSQTQKNVSEPQTGIEPATFFNLLQPDSFHLAKSSKIPCIVKIEDACANNMQA